MTTTYIRPLDPDRRTAPQIYDRLREQILSLDIPPNAVLVRAELQQQFGVSQTPVRDALMRLERDGLVDVFPQHATRVSRIDLRSAREAHFMRLSVELEAITLTAMNRTDDDLALLEAVLERQQEAGRLGDLNAFTGMDEQFHAMFYRIAGVGNLNRIVKSLSVHIDRLRKLHLPLPGKLDAVMHDHRLICDAIRNRDVEAARWALRRHLSGTLSMLPKIAESYPDFLTDDDQDEAAAGNR